MHLTLLPPINLPSAREFVKFEVTRTGRPVQTRPALSTRDSLTSSHSASTETSTSSSPRRNRPSLSPEALLTHGYGPAALSKLSPPASSGSSIGGSKSSTPSGSVSSVTPDPLRIAPGPPKGKRSQKYACHPPPPPRGTFRSVPKAVEPTPFPERKLPLTELIPFRAQRDALLEESGRDYLCCECGGSNPRREQPMSAEAWYEKVEERRERRKLLRLKTRVKDKERRPINHQTLEGSTCVPPGTDISGKEKAGLGRRNYSVPVLSDPVHTDLKEHEEESSTTITEKGEESPSQGEMPLTRRKSIIEMRDIGNLIERCDSIRLEDTDTPV